MNINDAFPSKYLKSSDLPNGQQLHLTMANVVVETLVDGNEKPILYFQDQKKGLALNVTNKDMIVSLYGPETDGWVGKPIMLFVATTSYQGKATTGLRVAPPAQSNEPPPVTQVPAGPGDALPNDDIPF